MWLPPDEPATRPTATQLVRQPTPPTPAPKRRASGPPGRPAPPQSPGLERFACFVGTWIVGLTTSPLVQPPGADREFYRYVGMIWAQGGMPYRDVFDIKPPLIFLCAWDGSAWLLWAAVNAMMAIAALALWETLRRFRVPSPWLWVFIWLTLMRWPTVVEGGGLSYEVSAALCAVIASLALRQDPALLRMGVLIGVVSFTQQSDLLGLLPFVLLLLRRDEAPILAGVRVGVGIALVWLVCGAYFLQQDVLLEWLQDTWAFPSMYFARQSLGLPERVAAFARGLWGTRLLPLLLWALAWHALNTLLVRSKRRDTVLEDAAQRRWGHALTWALIFQGVAICIPGKFYGHYYLSFIVYLTVFAGLAWRIGAHVVPILHTRTALLLAVLTALVGAAAGVNTSPRLRAKADAFVKDCSQTVSAWRDGTTPYARAMANNVASFADVRGQNGQLFVFRGYGPSTALYTELGMRAPTRYVHQLFWDTSLDGPSELKAVMRDLDAAGTRYVLDYSPSKPLAHADMDRAWVFYRDKHYTPAQILPCDTEPEKRCGRVYVRRQH